MMKLFCATLFIIISTLALSGQAQCLTGDGDSLIRATKENSAAIRRFDLLVAFNSSCQISDCIDETETLLRVKLDADEQKCFYAINSKKTRISFSRESDKSESGSHRFDIYRVDGESYSHRSFPGPARHGMVSVGSFENALVQIGLPNFEAIGIFRFSIDPQNEIVNRSIWDSLLHLTQKHGTTIINSDRTTLRINAPLLRNTPEERDMFKVLSYYEFDNRSLMPVVRNLDISLSDKGAVKIAPRERESIEWEERSGVYVPVAMHSNEAHTMKTQEGVKEPTEKITEVQFHWISVNKPLGMVLPDGQDSLDSLLRMTDPEAVKP